MATVKISDKNEVRIDDGGGRERTYRLTDYPGNRDTVAASIKADMQADLDTVQAIADLPSDDPDKTTDPATVYGERMFWRGTDVVSRETIVDDMAWAADQQRYVIRLRLARGLDA